MKYNIDNDTLQAAMNAACEEVANGPHRPMCAELALQNKDTSDWEGEAPARLALAKALLDRLPEPAPPDNTELESFRSFFGKASLILHSIDQLGDNGSTEDFLKRLADIPGFKATQEEREAINNLRISQDLTAAQVCRQALRHYQLAVQGQPMPPPVVDGKTPGQIGYDAMVGFFKANQRAFLKWEDLSREEKAVREIGASAVLAAFGADRGWKAKYEEASKVAEEWAACSNETLQELGRTKAQLEDALDTIKQSDSAIGGWNEASDEPLADNIRRLVLKYGEVKAELSRQTLLHTDAIAYANGNPAFQGYCDGLRAEKEKAEAELARITEAAHEAGWNGVENPKDVAAFIKGQDELLKQWSTHIHPEAHDRIVKGVQERAKVAIQEARQEGLSRLRPLSEAGLVPEGCVRVTGSKNTDGEWELAEAAATDFDTHFADIWPPKQAGTPVEQADPYAELKAAHKAGKVIQCKLDVPDDVWDDMPDPQWGAAPHEYRIKPAETFEAHGHFWTRHTPGDPMPCDGEATVEVLLKEEMHGGYTEETQLAREWCWEDTGDSSVIGWRYADAPAPEPMPDWTPKVGHKVQLKGGSFVMTVEQIDSDGIACEWHDANGAPQARTYKAATLQPA